MMFSSVRYHTDPDSNVDTVTLLLTLAREQIDLIEATGDTVQFNFSMRPKDAAELADMLGVTTHRAPSARLPS